MWPGLVTAIMSVCSSWCDARSASCCKHTYSHSHHSPVVQMVNLDFKAWYGSSYNPSILTTCESFMPCLHCTGRDNYSIRYQLHVTAENCTYCKSADHKQVSDLSWPSLCCRTWDRTDGQTDGWTDRSIAYCPPQPPYHRVGGHNNHHSHTSK